MEIYGIEFEFYKYHKVPLSDAVFSDRIICNNSI